MDSISGVRVGVAVGVKVRLGVKVGLGVRVAVGVALGSVGVTMIMIGPIGVGLDDSVASAVAISVGVASAVVASVGSRAASVGVLRASSLPPESNTMKKANNTRMMAPRTTKISGERRSGVGMVAAESVPSGVSGETLRAGALCINVA